MKVHQTELIIVHKGQHKSLLRKSALQHRGNDSVTEHDVRSRYRSIFMSAKKKKLPQLSFSDVGIQEGFPAIGSAKILSQEILRFCRAFPGALKSMTLEIQDKSLFSLFKEQVYGYLRHVQEDLGQGPYVTVDILIELKEGLVLIERTNPPFGYALPGGFVDNFESVEDAARREAKEETNLDLVQLRQFHTYSDPGRDPRFHTVSTAFIAQGKGTPRSGDDAKGLKVIAYNALLRYPYAFDHGQIIKDYLAARRKR